MTYILTRVQIQQLHSRVRKGITVSKILRAAVDAVVSGRAQVAPDYPIMEKREKVPLARMSIKKRIPGIGSVEMRQILDAYFRLEPSGLQDQIDQLDAEIALMMNQTVAQRTKRLAKRFKHGK